MDPAIIPRSPPASWASTTVAPPACRRLTWPDRRVWRDIELDRIETRFTFSPFFSKSPASLVNHMAACVAVEDENTTVILSRFSSWDRAAVELVRIRRTVIRMGAYRVIVTPRISNGQFLSGDAR